MPSQPPAETRGKRRARQRAWARVERRLRASRRGVNDRGTVLLMVLGVLALMAIIAVVYAAVGKADRSTSAAMVRAQRIDEQVDQMARYMADVIGRDVFATYAQEDYRQRTGANFVAPAPRLEAYDAPETDMMMVSQRDTEDGPWQNRQRDGFYLFNPEGTITQAWRSIANPAGNGAPANRRDPRRPSDPFLGATEPSFLNRASIDWSFQQYAANEDYLNKRDWLHISNLNPSGNFVNLWALRNNFRAESGFQTDTAGRPRLSSQLTLINPATGYSYPAANADQDPNTDIGGAMRLGNLTGRPRLNRPADWTRDQVGAFRTTAEVSEADGAPYGVDDPEFMAYQWADADGDGFYDGRWGELVDISDPDNSRPLVTSNGRVRLFYAARVVDLTGLVNVNTAGNFQFEPRRYYAKHQGSDGVGLFDPVTPVARPGDTNFVQPTGPLSNNWLNYRDSVEQSFHVPAGLTPADVDLQRLLRMSDAFYAYELGNNGVGYDDLPQPRSGANAPGDYRAYDPNNNRRNEYIGNAAFQSLEIARLGDLPSNLRFTDPDNQPAPGVPAYTESLKVAASRYAFYDGYGTRREPGRQPGTGLLNRYGRPFGEADELELRTFQGLNDPARTSRLEGALAGRYDGDPGTYTLSPLRDDRPTELERAGRDIPQPDDLASTRPPNDSEYRKALLAADIDVRRLITTINGARPIIGPVLVDMNNGSTTQLSEAAGTIRVDGSRLVSRMVETGNWSFERTLGSIGNSFNANPCQDLWRNRVAPLKEDTWDTYGWFFDNTGLGREWFYRTLDNLPPGGQYAPPAGRITQIASGETENFEISRLDLMREAFRSYLDCLLPYSQWGSDPQNRTVFDGPFPNAWDATDPTSSSLAYGGNAELAYRMAAHLAANLRDALDTDRRSRNDSVLIQDDNVQTAVTLDLTMDAVNRTAFGTQDLSAPNPPPINPPAWGGYQRDRDYPWAKLNLDDRFTATDDKSARTRLTPDGSLIPSVRGTTATGNAYGVGSPVKRVNIFGIEAQPFITQVTAMSMYVDTPPSSITPTADDEAAGAQQPTIPGQPPPPPPPITIDVRRDIGTSDNAVGNPDFLCTVLAFQITNPFETDIELEPANPSATDSWYYIEYANRYYRLVPQSDMTPNGMVNAVPDAQRILRAGETRVFYATYPNSIKDVSRRFNRAQRALAERFSQTAPTYEEDFFEQFAKHEFGDNSVHVAPMYPETGQAIGAPGNGQGLTNVELFAIPPTQVGSGLTDVGGGPNGERPQPSFNENDDTYSDNRRVVYLWRVLRDPDAQDGGAGDLGSAPATSNWTGNDLLLDRLRDPSDRSQNRDGTLIEAAINAFGTGNSNIEVPNTRAGIDEVGRNAEDNTGFSLISWRSIVRPSNPARDFTSGGANFDGRVGADPEGKSPAGAMPPWCLEAKPDNIYTPGFEQQSTSMRLWSLNRVRGVDGIGTKARYGDASYSYYKELDDLVGKHFNTSTRDSSRQQAAVYPNPPSATDAKFVDRDLSVQFAELRGGRAYPSNSSNANDYREQYSIVDIDDKRLDAGAETQWFDGRPRRFDQVAVEIHRLPPDKTGSAESQSTPSRVLFSRVGDFLLPLAIGPWHDPSAELSGTSSRAQLLDAQWTTLSEVLALACDYYSPPQYLDAPQGSGGTRSNIFHRFGRDTRNDPFRSNPVPIIPKADRGQLVLDAYSPYLDFNTGTFAYQWSELDPSNNTSLRATRDAPLGNGIPLALNIPDKFRVAGLPAETRAKPSDPRQCPLDTANDIYGVGVGQQFAVAGRSQAYGSATKAEPGRINANTAPLAVLRALPMLSPTPDTLNASDPNLLDSWLYDGRFTNDAQAQLNGYDIPDTLAARNPPIPRTAATRLWDPTATAPNQSPWDIAASLVAYRDQIAMPTRSFQNQPSILVDYRDSRDGNGDLPIARSGRDDAFHHNLEDPSQGGLRDHRGIQSLGEILAIDIRRSTDPAVITRAQQAGYPTSIAPDVENSITRLARDGASNRSLAIDSVGYKQDRAKTVFGAQPGTDSAPNMPNSTNTLYPNRIVADGADGIPDDYDEKLSIANALLNTLTVRSDYFCVWFVVNGYTPEDVQVDDGFPLVPSIARRYMMVVDRSNVDSPTAKPRIVMFREVPMP